MLSTTDPSAQFTPGRDCATANIADNDRRFLEVNLFDLFDLCFMHSQ